MVLSQDSGDDEEEGKEEEEKEAEVERKAGSLRLFEDMLSSPEGRQDRPRSTRAPMTAQPGTRKRGEAGSSANGARRRGETETEHVWLPAVCLHSSRDAPETRIASLSSSHCCAEQVPGSRRHTALCCPPMLQTSNSLQQRDV